MKQRTPLRKIAIVFRCLFSVAFPWLSVNGDESVRADFARALGSVTINMSPLAVERLLGKPDDVRTQLDPGGISTNHTEEIWCYGTSGRLTFPTLGNIYMKQDGVQYIHGGNGKSFDPALLNEGDLRVFLQKIDILLESRSSNPLLYDLLSRLEYSTPIKHRTMVNVYQCDADRTLLTRFFIPATAETQSVQQSDYISLPSGANVQVEIVSDGKTVTSEVMTP